MGCKIQQNVDDFKKGDLTFEEFHGIQRQLFIDYEGENKLP